MNNTNCLVTLKTVEPRNITYTSLTTGGKNLISSDPIVEKGVVWALTSDPTIFSIGKKAAGSGMGDFDMLLEGLVPGTTYFIRAYAIGKDGSVTYGNNKLVTLSTTSSSDNCNTVYHNIIMPGTAYIVPAGATVVSVTDDLFLTTTCGEDLVVDPMACFGVYVCGTADDGSETDHYNKIFVEGLIINGVKTPFNITAEVVSDGGAGTQFNLGIEAIVTGIKDSVLGIQGIISGVYKCPTNGDPGSGFCSAITLRTTASIAKDMRLYGYIRPANNIIDEDKSNIQFPFLSKQEMLDVNFIELCACTDES